MKEPKFTYIAGRATCETEDYLGRKFVGHAKCHQADHRYESEKIGCKIAEDRATIQALVAYKNDLKVRLSALYQLYYSMKQSSHFNPKSYENKMLWRQIHLTENDLEIAKQKIQESKIELYRYIEEKDKFHKKLAQKARQR